LASDYSRAGMGRRPAGANIGDTGAGNDTGGQERLGMA
jgi:hypothetical protein